MASIYPTEVAIDEQKIAKLTEVFKESYKTITKEILTATDFGVRNRKQILSQIRSILEELGVNVQEFVDTEIPAAYKQGAAEAVKQLNNVKADISVSTGFNTVHTQTISALVDDTAKAFAESITGVNRSANLLLGRATREVLTQKLAEGMIGGKALRSARQTIKGVLQEQGLSALVDKGGHTWSLDRYAEMLYRTKVVEARNRGLVNRLVENGHDLVQVSSHNSSHKECADWEGKILSITGETPGFPTLDDAESSGLFHPNCQHAINALSPSIAKMTKAYYVDEKSRSIGEAEMQKLEDMGLL